MCEVVKVNLRPVLHVHVVHVSCVIVCNRVDIRMYIHVHVTFTDLTPINF